MSITKETTIWCDGENCGEWEQFTVTAKAARRILRDLGWITVRKAAGGVDDYCPKCSGELCGRESE